jgi:hypothetical protein
MTIRIKSTIYSLLFLTTFTSCGQKINTDFPKSINTTKTDKQVRVNGTKVYGFMPADFQYIKELARYQKNEKLYIQVVESNASNFVQAKPNFTRQAIEAKGAKIDVLNNIKLNEFDAIYGEGPSKYPDETKLMLIFGDESFVVMVVGVCKTADKEGKKELQEIFKSIYYEKSFSLNPLELANFEFDQSITNFKYAMTASNLFMYTENGKNDAQNATANSFQIGVLPQMTEEKAESYSNDLPWRYEKNGIKLDNKTITKTKINNHTAYILETKIKSDNKDGIMYQAVLVSENTTLIFMASAFNDTENYLAKFKKTAETIKEK